MEGAHKDHGVQLCAPYRTIWKLKDVKIKLLESHLHVLFWYVAQLSEKIVRDSYGMLGVIKPGEENSVVLGDDTVLL